jgi:hypothetical protein
MIHASTIDPIQTKLVSISFKKKASSPYLAYEKHYNFQSNLQHPYRFQGYRP